MSLWQPRLQPCRTESRIKPSIHYPLPAFNKQLSAFPAHATFAYLPCPGGGMADAEDLKSSEDFSSWEFESPPGHFRLKHLRRIERLSESSNPPPNYLIFTSALRSPY